MSAARRRKTSTRVRLTMANVRLRAIRDVLRSSPLHAAALVSQPKAGPQGAARFIQCWAVHGRPVTQALDASGQVWERVYRKATDTTPAESWWEPLSMTRKGEPHP